jgi:hypothetical protein
MTDTDKLLKALGYLRPGAQRTVTGGVVEWLDIEQAEPTQAEIDACIAAAPWEAQEALAASDSIMDRLTEDLLDNAINGTPIPQAAIDKLAEKKAARSA